MVQTESSTPLLLETRCLSKEFGGVHALDGVNFRLRRGELRSLIGPNGAGKSTFFKILSGQLQPSKGDVLFDGKAIVGLPPHRIARLGIGIKNQVPSLWDGLSVYEHFWLAAYRHTGKRGAMERADRLLQQLGLWQKASQSVGTLSHGERQWVEIGMVMAQEPLLLLLDEPAAGMTEEEVERTAALLRAINTEASLIVVEHDMQFIRMLEGLVTVFYQGRVLMEDTIDAVLADAKVREVYLGTADSHG
ncbi:MAG: ATP-binding cassette domain-containing protein [Acidobacteriia bacterium]|nr:ATP-binding cassette domain-containing protein [Methyloceanibacter sp.]MCL6490625.1 ATP-binding cassette domain-containing protein [Terriglobia bacterium]